MRWSWLWKGAVAAFVLWEVWVFGLLGLNGFSRCRWAPRLPWFGLALRVRNVLAGPAQPVVNWTWRRVGYRLPPKGPTAWRPDRSGKWLLRTARVSFRQQVPRRWGSGLTFEYLHPTRWDVALHLVLLPGLTASVVGLWAGFSSAVLAWLLGLLLHTSEPEEGQ